MRNNGRILILIGFLAVNHIDVYSQRTDYHYTDATETSFTLSNQDSLSIKFVDSRLIVENLKKDEILEIFNIMGVKVFSRRIKSGTNEYHISLPKGYYIIRIGKLTKKIIIK